MLYPRQMWQPLFFYNVYYIQMDIRPTREKSADEIHRIQASVRRNFDADQPEILLIPTVVPLFTQSAPVLQRKWETLLLCRDHQGSRRGYRS